jgi:hypothetical protein
MIMEFEDLIKRIFVVRLAEEGAKHTPDDIVTFDGTADEVIMRCIRYPPGVYKNGTISGGTVEDKDAYMVTIAPMGDHIQVKLDPLSEEGSGGAGGSWTANDMPTEPGNG